MPTVFMGESLLSVNGHQLNRDRRYVVKGLLMAGQVSMLCGAPNTGKSAVIAAVAAHVAKGRDFAGYRTCRAAVLYVAAEDPNGIADRAHPYLNAGLNAASPFNIFPLPINLCSDRQIDHFVGELIAYQTAANCDRLLTVIDTLNLCIGEGDENSARDMGRAIGNAQRVARETGAHVMIIHHTAGHDGNRPRGSTAMEGNVDTLLTLHRADEQQPKGVVFIAQRKQRSVKKGEPVAFRIQAFDGGIDSEGDRLTVPMAVPFEPKSSLAAQTKRKQTKPSQADERLSDLRRVLDDLATSRPNEWFDATTIRDNTGTPFNSLRDNTESLGRIVRKFLQTLLESGEIEKNEDGHFRVAKRETPNSAPDASPTIH
ncbi:AAA family ATPase [Pelagovum pacificum]|nr:AAA family ATPase [Pelagovum pacificum]QQA44512.1 AAA family ATPase [Pelagovum pacificum]